MAFAIPFITAFAALASAGTSIYKATQGGGGDKPPAPASVTGAPNQEAITSDNQRRAAAQGRGSTILTAQKLGNVGA